MATNTTLYVKIDEVEKEVPSITNLVTSTALNIKINEVINKIPNITDLATTPTLIGVENKKPNAGNLVKKFCYNTQINEIENKITSDHDHDKYITAQKRNNLTSENVTTRLKQANLESKSDIANFVKKTDFDYKLKNVTSNKNKLNELSKVKKISIK